MFNLLIEDIETSFSEEVLQISKQDQEMTVGGCCCCCPPPPPPPPPSCDPKLVGCGDQNDPAFVF